MRPSQGRRLPSWVIGLAMLVLVAIASVLAFTKNLPWGDAYEVKAVFSSAQSVRASSPVRIAGVEVGKVTSIEPLTSPSSDGLEAQVGDDTPPPGTDEAPGQQAAVVTMELKEDALPLHADAQFKLRPRLFLEGNYFVDIQPGSPNAPETEDGHTFPVNQTAYSVQFDEVLTTLQADVRTELQVFLDQFGNALTKHGGAEGFQELFRSSPRAYRYTAQVSEALLGTAPGDLGGVIHGLDRVVRGLGRNEETLKDLVTNFRIFSGSFAAEDVALGRAIEELPNTLEASRPALINLNASFPALRAFAREALPGVRSTPETLRAATPFVAQIRQLVARDELRGLVSDLRPTIPKLARLSRSTIPFLEQTRALSSCFNEVVIPWSQDTVDPLDPSYPHEPVGRVFEETAYGLSGINSESRSGDANGQYVRVGAGSGANLVTIPNAVPGLAGGLQDAVGSTALPLLGAMPRIEDSAKTPFKPNVACETQEPPNLEAGGMSDVPFNLDPGTGGLPLPDLPVVLADLTRAERREAAVGAGLPPELVKIVADLVEEGE